MRVKRWELSEKNKFWVQTALAFMGAYGVCYLAGLAGAVQASFSVMSVLVMGAVFGMLSWTRRNLEETAGEGKRRRRCRYAGIVSFLFSVSMIMGYQLQANGLTECGVKGKGLILIRGACLAAAVFPFGNLLFWGIEKAGEAPGAESGAGRGTRTAGKSGAGREPSTAGKSGAGRGPRTAGESGRGKRRRPWAVFGISAAVIFTCLIPVWLAYYPVIMSYDFHRQVNEAQKGFAWFWPYQPIAHTWVIWLFLQLGHLLGNLEAGMAGMALFQMLAYALVTGYACTFLCRVTGKLWTAVAGVLFFGVFPLNSVMVICTTKDVLFSVLFLLFVLLMAERFFFGRGRALMAADLLWLLVGCIMMQFRNNAIYAAAVFGVLWLVLSPRREKLRVLLLVLLLTAGGRVTGAVIKAVLGTELTSSKVEMYSVPIQQFARVGYYHGSELDEGTWLLLDSYISAQDWENYNPPIADTVKGRVGGTTFPVTWEGHTARLFADWCKIGLQYPNEYIDAFLELTRGYWFWDDRSYAECLGYGAEERMGVIYTYNSSEIEELGEIVHESKFPWLEEQLEKIVSANAFYRWPVVSVLFKSAFYFWGLCLVFVAFLYLGKKKQAVFCLFPLVYMGTMLLGPVVQLRYIFPVMVTLPVSASLLAWRDGGQERA